jgi:phosphatidylserine decarboxylase
MIVLLAGIFIGLIILFLLLHKYYFLRDPERTIPKGNIIVSPADGTIIHVGKFTQPAGSITKGLGKNTTEYSSVGKEGYIISIFMSAFNVHINRAPIEGTVVAVTHKNGRFLPARDQRALLENEKTEIIIKGKKYTVMTILIAGIMARRIVAIVKNKQQVSRGERIGMIKLGSQATLILPSCVKIKVAVGDRVRAGESIIAEDKT